MEETPKNQESRISFINQPRMSEKEADQEVNEKRQSLVPQVEDWIDSEELFQGKEVEVEFSHKGVSSLVCFIKADKNYVLKVSLYNSHSLEGETQFLKEWENAGVSVPHIFKEGEIGGQSYILMDFVDAPTLSDAMKEGKVEGDISFELGKILRTMHRPEADGYGKIIDGSAEFSTFSDWINSEAIVKKISYAKENNILSDDEHGSISKAIEILVAYVSEKQSSTYCHYDFGSDNILATEPLTVIDPNPILNDGIIDIGRSMHLAIAGGFSDAAERMKDGYSAGYEESLDPRVLQASILLSAYTKFQYWNERQKTDRIENTRKYLAENKNVLE